MHVCHYAEPSAGMFEVLHVIPFCKHLNFLRWHRTILVCTIFFANAQSYLTLGNLEVKNYQRVSLKSHKQAKNKWNPV